MKILMVCLGNICRSPMAQGILEHTTRREGLDWVIDSAGTSRWHIGEKPDSRAIAVCRSNGINITDQRARQFTDKDFEEYDLILTMDESNRDNVMNLAASEAQRAKVSPILSYAGLEVDQVPDPYYDGRFQDVFDMLKLASEKIVAKNIVS